MAATGSFFHLRNQITNHLFSQSQVIDGLELLSLESLDEVDPERGVLKVLVSVFGREAPVELEYWQVERSAE